MNWLFVVVHTDIIDWSPAVMAQLHICVSTQRARFVYFPVMEEVEEKEKEEEKKEEEKKKEEEVEK